VLIKGHAPLRLRGQLGFGLGFITLLALTSGWILVRLVSREKSANNVTVIPAWFIELVGVFLATALVAGMIWGGLPFFVVGWPAAVLPMMFVRRHLRNRFSTNGHGQTAGPPNSNSNDSLSEE
jgi:hypothetical protein